MLISNAFWRRRESNPRPEKPTAMKNHLRYNKKVKNTTSKNARRRPFQPNKHRRVSKLGRKLRDLRGQIAASGEKLLSLEDLQRENLHKLQ